MVGVWLHFKNWERDSMNFVAPQLNLVHAEDRDHYLFITCVQYKYEIMPLDLDINALRGEELINSYVAMAL